MRQVRELTAAIDKAKGALDTFGKSPGMAAAIGETDGLAASWANVTKNADAARLAMGKAGTAATRSAATASGGAGGGRHRPGWLGGGSRSSGGHHLGGPAMAAAAALGWGVDQAARTEDFAWQLTRHAGLDQNKSSHARFRKILQDAQIRDAFDLKSVGEAALQDIRMMQGTPGAGLDSLPEMLHIAAVEARSKGSPLGESMTATIGLSHMLRAYGENAMLKLAPTFAAISTADPRSLTAMERGAGYALPTMQAIGADPITGLLLGTPLARAGVLSTKSGTWLREAATRAMPGTSLMSKMAFKKHEEALKAFGLVGDDHQPTWFTDGRPDLMKLHEIAGSSLQAMPLAQRAGNLRAAFGSQGAGDIGVLGDPVVLEQVRQIWKMSQSPEFLESYRNFSGNYQAGSTMQDARVALATFNVTMGELARMTLPSINVALGVFKSTLEGIRNVLPGGSGQSAATVGGHAIFGTLAGAGIGAAWGAFGGPVGMAGGALAGGVIGGMEGVAEEYMRGHKTGQVITGNSVAQTVDAVHSLAAAIRGAQASPGGVFAGGTSKDSADQPLSQRQRSGLSPSGKLQLSRTKRTSHRSSRGRRNGNLFLRRPQPARQLNIELGRATDVLRDLMIGTRVA